MNLEIGTCEDAFRVEKFKIIILLLLEGMETGKKKMKSVIY